MTKTAVAKELNISKQRLHQLAESEPAIFSPPEWTPAAVAVAKVRHGERVATSNNPSGTGATSTATIAPALDQAAAVDPDLAAAIKANPERRAKLSVLIERAAKLRLERELLLGIYIRQDEVTQGLAQTFTMFRSRMLNFGANIAARLEGLPADEIHREIDREAGDVLDALADSFAKLDDSAPARPDRPVRKDTTNA